MIFDDVRALEKKKKVSFREKCKFLSEVPDCTISMHVKPGDPSEIEKAYSKDDVNELFDYWFGIYKGMADKRGYIWE